MRKEDKPIRSITDLLTNLQSDTSDYYGPIWFRRHSIGDWKLLSSLQRLADPPSATMEYKLDKEAHSVYSLQYHFVQVIKYSSSQMAHLSSAYAVIQYRKIYPCEYINVHDAVLCSTEIMFQRY